MDPTGILEAGPEIAEVTGLTSDSISWKIEEDSEESVVSLGEVMREVTSIRFDVGQLMRWPDRNSDDKLICEFRLESELFSHDPAWREAEPVFVAAESEIFTPVFAGGSLLSRNPRLWQGSYITSFCSADGWKQIPDRSVCGRWRRGPVVFKLG